MASFRASALLAASVLLLAGAARTASAEPAFGFSPGERLPVYAYHGADGAKRTTAEFRGRWFLFKRVAERPGLDAFMKAHPEVPVVMAVTSPKGTNDVEGQLQRDAALQQRKGFRSDIVAVVEGREPTQAQLPTPQSVTDIPLTIVVDPDGVVAGVWNSTHAYQRHYGGRGVVGRAEPEFRDYVEAVMLCRGAKGLAATPAAREVAASFGPSCS